MIQTNSIGGEPPRVLARNQNKPVAITTDGRSVYWVNSWGSTMVDGGDPRTLMKLDLSSGVQSVLASVQDQLARLVVDDTSVYWTDLDSVFKVAK